MNQQKRQCYQAFDFNNMNVFTPPFDFNKEDGAFMFQNNSNLIPSPPCSVPDISFAQQVTPATVATPLFDHSHNSLGIIDTSGEFNTQNTARVVIEQPTQIMPPPLTTTNTMNTAQYDSLSREELIARLVELETEKLLKTQQEEEEEGEETELEELEQEELEQKQEEADTEQMITKTCQWTNCDEKFTVLQELISHITEAHVGGGKPTYRCEWEDCVRNNKPFTKRHKMYNHLRTHTGERPFVCPKPDCEKKFSRPDSLTTHIKTHSTVRPFICSFKGCGKAYYHARSLKKHERIHLLPSYQQAIEITAPFIMASTTAPIIPMSNMPSAVNITSLPVDNNNIYYPSLIEQQQPFIQDMFATNPPILQEYMPNNNPLLLQQTQYMDSSSTIHN